MILNKSKNQKPLSEMTDLEQLRHYYNLSNPGYSWTTTEVGIIVVVSALLGAYVGCAIS